MATLLTASDGAHGQVRLGLGVRTSVTGLQSGAEQGQGMGLGFGGVAVSGLGLEEKAAGSVVSQDRFTVSRGLGSTTSVSPGSATMLYRRLLSRGDEKRRLANLNERFFAYVSRVHGLQKENVALEARLAEVAGSADSSTETVSVTEQEAQLKEYRNNLTKLSLDVVQLEIELDGIRGVAHELKAK